MMYYWIISRIVSLFISQELFYRDHERWSMTLGTYIQLTMLEMHQKQTVSFPFSFRYFTLMQVNKVTEITRLNLTPYNIKTFVVTVIWNSVMLKGFLFLNQRRSGVRIPVATDRMNHNWNIKNKYCSGFRKDKVLAKYYFTIFKWIAYTGMWRHILSPATVYADTAAHIVASKHIFSTGWHFYLAYTVVGYNTRRIYCCLTL